MRVLIVTYFLPPSRAIGGQRPAALAAHLSETGNEVRVLYRDNLTGRAHLASFEGMSSPTDASAARAEAEHSAGWRRWSLLSRASRASYKFRHTLLDRPDAVGDWRRESLRIVRDELGDWRPEVVVSSAPPPSTHLVARKVAQEFGIPWLPDYRDLWSNSTYYPYLRWRRLLDELVETRCLRDASVVTAATEGFSADLQALLGNTPVVTIMNGYSRGELASTPAQDLGPGWHLAYAGNWYGSKRDPEPVLRAMRDRSELSDVVLHFVGPANEMVDDVTRRYGLSRRVRFHGVLPRAAALGVVKGANAALLLTWNDPRDAGVIPGKIYEYLGMERPIVALGYPAGVVAGILRDSGLGFVANDPDEIAEAVSAIRLGLGPAGPLDFQAALEYERGAQLELWADLIRSGETAMVGREA